MKVRYVIPAALAILALSAYHATAAEVGGKGAGGKAPGAAPRAAAAAPGPASAASGAAKTDGAPAAAPPQAPETKKAPAANTAPAAKTAGGGSTVKAPGVPPTVPVKPGTAAQGSAGTAVGADVRTRVEAGWIGDNRPDPWRYKVVGNRWWYWTPENRWMLYFDQGGWTYYEPSGVYTVGYGGVTIVLDAQNADRHDQGERNEAKAHANSARLDRQGPDRSTKTAPEHSNK